LLDTGKGTLIADGIRLLYRGKLLKDAPPPITLFVGARPIQDRGKDAGFPCEAGLLGSRGTVAVGLRDCWQNFPSALTVSQAGSVQIDLLAGGPHTFMGGMGKTWDLFWTFTAKGTEGSLVASLQS